MKYLLILSALILAIGCSDVNFEPADSEAARRANANAKTDSFFFDEDRPLVKVDVLFIIDNSGSMLEEQQKLASRLSSFVGTLSKVDWQIGITTTDVSNGPWGLKGNLVQFSNTRSKVLSRKTPNYEKVFLDTVTANGTPPTCGPTASYDSCPSGDEQPLAALLMALSLRETANAEFFRPDADLAVIVLSDEDEMSNGDLTKNPVRPTHVLEATRTLWGDSKVFSAYGIIVQPGDSMCFNQQASNDGKFGTFVSDLSRLTGGVTGSICDEDYSRSLKTIGKRVTKLTTTVHLRSTPLAGSVEVTLTPHDPSITWQIFGKSVRLSDLPKKGTRVDVSYLTDPVKTTGGASKE